MTAVASPGLRGWLQLARTKAGGAVQGKAMDSEMAKRMTFVARRGHPCGENFLAAPFLKAHSEYSWQQPVLRDMIAGPWTIFHSGQRGK